MQIETYEIEIGESGRVFQFVSEGPRGKIPKLVKFTELNIRGVYNLGFGDLNPYHSGMDDQARSDNGDAERVLATVVQTVLAFTTLYPRALIFAKGSTPARTRMYQIGISKHLEEILENFRVQGQIDGGWEDFRKGRSYQAFLAERINDEGAKAKKVYEKR
jgi:hypothetical protein